MSTCGEPCDGCPNRAEHHLCDACCHDEVNAIQKENRELREKLKEARAECARQMEYGTKQHEAAQDAIRERDEAQAWAKHRDEFAAAETEHANRWSVRARKAEAEVERLRGLAIHPTGVTWEQHHLNFKFMVRDELNATEAAAYQRGAEAMREAAALCVLDSARFWSAQYVADDIRALPVPEDKP